MSVHIGVLDDPDQNVFLANRLYFAFEEVVRPRIRSAPDLLELLEVTGLFGGIDLPRLAAESPELASRFARVLFDAAKDVAEGRVELPPTSVPYDPNDLRELFGRLANLLGQWIQSRAELSKSGDPCTEPKQSHPQSPNIIPPPKDNPDVRGGRRGGTRHDASVERLGLEAMAHGRQNAERSDLEDDHFSSDPDGRHSDRALSSDGNHPVSLEIYGCCPGAWRLSAAKIIKDYLGVSPQVAYELVQSLCNERKPLRLFFESTSEADGLGQRLARCGFHGRLMINGKETSKYEGTTDVDER